MAIILVSHELVLSSLFLGQNNVANELNQSNKKEDKNGQNHMFLKV